MFSTGVSAESITGRVEDDVIQTSMLNEKLDVEQFVPGSDIFQPEPTTSEEDEEVSRSTGKESFVSVNSWGVLSVSPSVGPTNSNQIESIHR